MLLLSSPLISFVAPVRGLCLLPLALRGGWAPLNGIHFFMCAAKRRPARLFAMPALSTRRRLRSRLRPPTRVVMPGPTRWPAPSSRSRYGRAASAALSPDGTDGPEPPPLNGERCHNYHLFGKFVNLYIRNMESSQAKQCSIFVLIGGLAMAGTKFGGAHTEEKLVVLEKYLGAYTTALKKQSFKTIYFDAFAGAGEIEIGDEASLLAEVDPFEPIIKGSVRRALGLRTPFAEYVLVDDKRENIAKLREVVKDYPTLKNRIRLIRGDANEVLRKFCAEPDWRSTRAVIFLDPYGNQVHWATLETIAHTQAVDLWYLFPAGTRGSSPNLARWLSQTRACCVARSAPWNKRVARCFCLYRRRARSIRQSARCQIEDCGCRFDNAIYDHADEGYLPRRCIGRLARAWLPGDSHVLTYFCLGKSEQEGMATRCEVGSRGHES